MEHEYDTPDGDNLTNGLTWRDYARLADRVAVAASANVATAALSANGTGGVPPQGFDPQSRRRPTTRRQRLAAEAQQRWAVRRAALLAALRELREETLPTPGAPDVAAAALFAMPALSELPALDPTRRPVLGDRGDDDGQLAEAEARWREIARVRAYYLARRVQHAEAYRLAPNNCWRKVGSVGERGGLRPGQRAFPAAWSAYLLRRDREEQLGEAWSSPLGRAFVRVERDYAGTPLLSVLWLMSEPHQVLALADVAARLGMALGACERWFEAALRRLAAEMAIALRGKARSGDELRAAERAEALAWRLA